MASNDVTDCVKALISRGWSIAFAESASAGLLSYEFSIVPNSGQILLGSLVCYHECLKKSLLRIPPELIEIYTAESSQVTHAMATRLKEIVNADVCVALTGLTTPGGSESPEKPVGTIFIHMLFPGDETASRFEFKGAPNEILAESLSNICQIIIQKCNEAQS